MDKALGSTGGAIVERFIKPRASTMLVHPLYSLDGPGTLIAILGTHEDFSKFLLEYGWVENIFHMVAADQPGCTKYGET